MRVKSKYNTEHKNKTLKVLSLYGLHSLHGLQFAWFAFWGDPVSDALLVYSNIQITKHDFLL